MKRILVEEPELTFFEYSPPTEGDFERQVLRLAARLFPNFHAGAWKPLIRDYLGRGAQPDMVLVSKGVDQWHIVEVELASHSISGHIAPQLETLSKGLYDKSLISSLASATGVPEAQLWNLVYQPPGLLVIVDTYTTELHRTCQVYNFELVVAEPYKAEGIGWALNAHRLPAALTQTPVAGRFVLRRGRIIGDSEVLYFPPHFPWSSGVVRLSTRGEEVNTSEIIVTAGSRYALVASTVIPGVGPLELVTLDLEKRLFRLQTLEEK